MKRYGGNLAEQAGPGSRQLRMFSGRLRGILRAAAVATVVVVQASLCAIAADAAGGGIAQVTPAWGGELSYDAAVGDQNSIEVTQAGSTYYIDDVVAITPGAGCSRIGSDPTIVACTANLMLISINGNDLDDSISNHTPTRALLRGGSGSDWLFTWSSGPTVLWGEAGNDALFGGSGQDFLSGDDGNDLLYGGQGDDWLHGEEGDDHLEGVEGNDELYGENGNDNLYGQDGFDKLDGGSGTNYLDGGAHNDTCRNGPTVLNCP